MEFGKNKKKKLWKQRYNVTCRFQEVWATKLPWSEAILRSDSLLHMVRCKTCSNGKKECVMGLKWDTLSKLGIRDCHKKNELLYAARQPLSFLEQIQGCTTIESHIKRVQFSTLFQVLCDGRPMTEFLSRFKLYEFLGVPDLPHMHWIIGYAWLIAEHI
jgi:hypothetical protein